MRETDGIQEYFGNHSIVGHHHSTGSEEGFEIVRKSGSTCIAGVHSDVDSACGD